jgi:hypothetical protein
MELCQLKSEDPLPVPKRANDECTFVGTVEDAFEGW